MSSPNFESVKRRHALARSAGAVMGGAVAAVILSLVTDMLMYKIGLLPQPGQPASSNALLLATVYRTIYGIFGSYIAARLAPNRPMKHALLLGILGFIVSVVGAAATWSRQPSLGPHWYPVALVVLALPTAWAGGKLRLMQLE
jgi:surface polysaccharide O-acyltransferase-like enzyme